MQRGAGARAQAHVEARQQQPQLRQASLERAADLLFEAGEGGRARAHQDRGAVAGEPLQRLLGRAEVVDPQDLGAERGEVVLGDRVDGPVGAARLQQGRAQRCILGHA